MKTKIEKAIGIVRMLFGFCPECNSSAPELYSCPVCNYHTQFPPNQATKDKWWRRFEMARCIHGRPMEDTNCHACVRMLFELRNPPIGNPRKG